VPRFSSPARRVQARSSVRSRRETEPARRRQRRRPGGGGGDGGGGGGSRE